MPCGSLAIQTGFLAAILERGGGTRVICATEPWSFVAHVQPGERLFLVPRWRVTFPIPYDLWPLTVGAAEIYAALCVWPQVTRWGTWEAEKYFREQVVPNMAHSGNRPSWWWQEP